MSTFATFLWAIPTSTRPLLDLFSGCIPPLVPRYIQTKMAEYAEELWEIMQDEKTHVYMCGLKGMESGMAECFGPIAEKNGIVWTEFAKAMKKADRYHVEVY